MTENPVNDQDKKTSLLTFPTDFPLKIMGANQDGFLEAILIVIQDHDPEFAPESVGQQYSKDANYMSIRATVKATSQEQLDNLYRALTSHPMVKIVL